MKTLFEFEKKGKENVNLGSLFARVHRFTSNRAHNWWIKKRNVVIRGFLEKPPKHNDMWEIHLILS